MSINIPTHFAQQYSTNINLLLQQKGSKLRQAVTTGMHSGKAASPVDQIGAVEANLVTSRFSPMSRVDAPTDRRWVYPKDYDLPQLLDSFDKLRLITDPSSAYVQNAVMAMGRKQDYEILTAVTGTAKTGVEGGTSTIFTAANEVDVATGGANSTLNMAKARAVKKLMMANHVDFDTEEVFVGLTAVDYDALMNEPEIISRDYSSNMVLESGKLKGVLGFKFIHCELIETVLAGTNEVTLPVWCKSGLYMGLWNDVQTSTSKRNDIQSEPWQAYCIQTIGATRLEEDKVYAIESYRA
jgi:hypothetical protein